MKSMGASQRRPIYMDHHATTPLDQRVFEAMVPYFLDEFGNAASVDHVYGATASAAVDRAREQIASLINARPDEIIFTSGATESDNLAIVGVAEHQASKGKHIISAATEHKAVLDTCAYLERRGWRVTYLPVDHQGLIDPDDVRAAITPETVLITVMTANNEVGSIAPVAEIGRIAKEHAVAFHTDAAQAAAYVDLDVERDNVSLMSLSAHKMYGPKGVGALYVRNRNPRIRLEPMIHGGGHERGFRSGTLNVPGIVGMGAASWLCRDASIEATSIAHLRDRLWSAVSQSVPGVVVNGSPERRLANNLSITIRGVENRSLLIALREDVAMSTGSACTTMKIEPSHVLRAMGRSDTEAHETVRLSLGRFTSCDDADLVAERLCAVIPSLRRLSRIA